MQELTFFPTLAIFEDKDLIKHDGETSLSPHSDSVSLLRNDPQSRCFRLAYSGHRTPWVKEDSRPLSFHILTIGL